jgi:predicted solute-binding protein
VPLRIYVTNASTSLTLAAGGIYTATSKGGTAIVAAGQVYSALTSSSKTLQTTIAVTDTRTESTLYLSLTTAQGSAATADVYVFADVLP